MHLRNISSEVDKSSVVYVDLFCYTRAAREILFLITHVCSGVCTFVTNYICLQRYGGRTITNIIVKISAQMGSGSMTTP